MLKEYNLENDSLEMENIVFNDAVGNWENNCCTSNLHSELPSLGSGQ